MGRFDEFKPTSFPDNRFKNISENDNTDIIIIGANCTHVFELPFIYSDYVKEVYVIYKQGFKVILDLDVESSKGAIEIEEIKESGISILTVHLTPYHTQLFDGDTLLDTTVQLKIRTLESEIYYDNTHSIEVIKPTEDGDQEHKPVAPDNEMSDLSKNAVQNKVIKAYVDNAISNIDKTTKEYVDGTVKEVEDDTKTLIESVTAEIDEKIQAQENTIETILSDLTGISDTLNVEFENIYNNITYIRENYVTKEYINNSNALLTIPARKTFNVLSIDKLIEIVDTTISIVRLQFGESVVNPLDVKLLPGNSVEHSGFQIFSSDECPWGYLYFNIHSNVIDVYHLNNLECEEKGLHSVFYVNSPQKDYKYYSQLCQLHFSSELQALWDTGGVPVRDCLALLKEQYLDSHPTLTLNSDIMIKGGHIQVYRYSNGNPYDIISSYAHTELSKYDVINCVSIVE